MSKKTLKKLIIIAVIAALVILFFAAGLNKYLNFSFLKESRAQFGQLYSTYPLPVIALYMLIYIVVTALSLPGATILTLAGGALFGLPVGIITVSFASSIGATLACFVSRYLFRDWVQNKFAEKLELINKGIEKEGGFYLFSLRLIPLFPFFVINLVMGLTKMPLLKFYWISQLGMLAGTIVYVNAGNEIGKLESAAGILSPRLILSFALLGLFPLIVKKSLEFYQKKFKKNLFQK